MKLDHRCIEPSINHGIARMAFNDRTFICIYEGLHCLEFRVEFADAATLAFLQSKAHQICQEILDGSIAFNSVLLSHEYPDGVDADTAAYFVAQGSTRHMSFSPWFTHVCIRLFDSIFYNHKICWKHVNKLMTICTAYGQLRHMMALLKVCLFHSVPSFHYENAKALPRVYQHPFLELLHQL